MFIPYKVDVPMKRWPLANIAIIGMTVAMFLGLLNTVIQKYDLPPPESMILDGWDLPGMFGHIVLHADWMHLLGNMIFLWVFGNAVCAKIGNICYPALYVGLGLCAAAAHNYFDGGLALGASGAVNGVVGLYLVLYPLNSVSCIYFVFRRPGTFSIPDFWIILLWLAFDILGVAMGDQGVGYWAHLGGFGAGFVIGILLLSLGLIEMEPTERSLLNLEAAN